MYIIIKGGVNIIINGITLLTLYDGYHFGEMALMIKKKTILD